jgi:ferredoxin
VQEWQTSGQVTGYQRRPRGSHAVAAAIHSRPVKIVVDADRCTGHGRCYSLAPELFDSDDDGHSVVIAAEVPAGLEAQARLAAENCPETCISLEG